MLLLQWMGSPGILCEPSHGRLSLFPPAIQGECGADRTASGAAGLEGRSGQSWGCSGLQEGEEELEEEARTVVTSLLRSWTDFSAALPLR